MVTPPFASGAEVLDPALFGSIQATVVVFVALLACSFFFSGTETAFFSLQERDRRRMEEGGAATDHRILRLLEKRSSLITTILMGNETANVLFSATAAGLFAALFPDKPWVTVVVATPVLVLLSEITPKVVAYRFNRRWAQIAVWPLFALYIVVTPVRWLVHSLVDSLARLFGVSPHEDRPGMREEEFLVLVEQGENQGVVEADEREMIEAVFELDDVPVSRLMTPRPDMFSLPIDMPWAELVAACQEARFSRVPMYEDHPDNVVGVLLIKDLLRHRRQPPPTAEALRELLLPPVVVPATRPASEMMRDMITRHLHMVFVADEHGTIMGLVSLDDLIIELVGELGDEGDEDPEVEIHAADGGWVVQGTVDLDDFMEHTGATVPEGGYHTVAGFVFHALGHVPRESERLQVEGFRYVILRMQGRRIAVVRVEPITADDASTAEIRP